ncbi:MAG: uroporphyrinogen-III C-methyltransferase [Betaproteobacteria bacterium]|nr:uroporphyrinogen-III C-methyltransferase [Betaproteobacteria bacterium]
MESHDTAPPNMPPGKPLRVGLTPGTLALILATLAAFIALGAIWLAYDSGRDITQNVGIKLGEISNAQKETAARTEQLARDNRDLQNRLSQLEGKLSEFQAQRISMEEMFRELARAPDDWLLAEIEQTLNIASRELVLAGNVRAALIALQGVDQRLARADKLQVVQLRRALTQDMERLKATPLVDTQGISLKLDSLMTQAATLPLALPDTLPTTTKTKPTADPADSFLVRAGKDLWGEIKQLIRIRELDNGDPSLLSPAQSYFLRENLKLRLLSARTALIARDEINYRQDLRLAGDMLARYFDPKARVNLNALTTIKQLAENPVQISAPDINASLSAIRSARAARERPAR